MLLLLGDADSCKHCWILSTTLLPSYPQCCTLAVSDETHDDDNDNNLTYQYIIFLKKSTDYYHETVTNINIY